MISQQVNKCSNKERLQSSPATNNAIRRAEQSGNIANQRFARTKGGLEVQHGNWEADKEKVGSIGIARASKLA